jgi:phosphoglycerate dehydrogenase-like enzyme
MSKRPTAVLVLVPAIAPGILRPDHLDRLRTLCEVPDAEPLSSFDEPRAGALLARAELLLTGWGCPPLSKEVLERAPNLRALFHAAGTVKNNVTEACWDRGLVVSSAAAANALPVAEYTLAAILFANKRVFQLQQRYRELRQFRLWPLEAPGLGNYRKRVGIVGASRIGRRVIELLQPFDLEVWVSDPYLDSGAAEALGVKLVELDELLSTCDVVSLHAPALPETHHLLDRRRLALLRDGSTLINTGRGSLVDARALEVELGSGRIFAVIDTTEPEVLPASSPLYELPNVLLTPHIAGSLGDETWRMVELALDEIERFVSNTPLQHGVRREDMERIA